MVNRFVKYNEMIQKTSIISLHDVCFYHLTFIARDISIQDKTAGSKKMLDSSLDKLAQQILSLDEASLASLWGKYKNRMENFQPSKEWEKAVIIFFIINAVRAKNEIFNEQILKMQSYKPAPPPPAKKEKPNLRLIKD